MHACRAFSIFKLFKAIQCTYRPSNNSKQRVCADMEAGNRVSRQNLDFSVILLHCILESVQLILENSLPTLSRMICLNV